MFTHLKKIHLTIVSFNCGVHWHVGGDHAAKFIIQNLLSKKQKWTLCCVCFLFSFEIHFICCVKFWKCILGRCLLSELPTTNVLLMKFHYIPKSYAAIILENYRFINYKCSYSRYEKIPVSLREFYMLLRIDNTLI